VDRGRLWADVGFDTARCGFGGFGFVAVRGGRADLGGGFGFCRGGDFDTALCGLAGFGFAAVSGGRADLGGGFGFCRGGGFA
jgi:hypothetical protein